MRRLEWMALLALLAAGCLPATRDRGGTDDGPSCEDGVLNGDEVDVDCGGGCAPCVNGQRCQVPAGCASGLCEAGACQAPSGCVPEADGAFCERLGKNCGEVAGVDGCGNARTARCGSCVAPQTCGSNHVCANGSGACTPRSCPQLDASCGRVPDGCGGTLDCGGCPAGQSCTSDHRCAAGACQPETDRQFCARLGKNCGQVTDFDNCDSSRTVASCGACASGQRCGGAAANVCCQPETDQQYCARLGASCGELRANDNCGSSRFAVCGSCASGQTCVGNSCRASSAVLGITALTAAADPQPSTGWGTRLGIAFSFSLSGMPNAKLDLAQLTFTAGPSGPSTALQPAQLWALGSFELDTNPSYAIGANGRMSYSGKAYLSSNQLSRLSPGTQTLELLVEDKATRAQARQSVTVQITACPGAPGSGQQLACAPENLCQNAFTAEHCGGCEAYRVCDRALSLVSESGTQSGYPYCDPAVAACEFQLGGHYWTCNDICQKNHAHCIKGPDGTSSSCGSQPLTSNRACFCVIDP